MKLLVIAALAAVALAADPKPKRQLPISSYDVAQKSVTGSFYYPTTPSPALHLPIHEHQDFGALISNFGESGYSTPLQYSSTTAAPPLAYSATPAPNVEVYSASTAGSLNPGYNSGFYSTPAPSVQFDGAFAGGFPAYNAYSNGYSGFGLGNIYSNVAQNIGTSGGSLSDAFGVSTPGPIFSGQSYSQETYVQHPEPEITKHVFFYSAPEEEVVQPRINVIQPVAKKNVKVIFVKAPVHQVNPVVKIAAPQQQEDKTVVYVLVKKPEETHQVIELQTQAPTAPAKPEVYFIKYKNQQEAEDAINKVQAGQQAAEGHLVGNDHAGGNDFVNTISLQKTVQPVVNYVKSSDASVPALLRTGYQQQYSVPLPGYNFQSGFDFSTASPLVSSTASPLINSNFAYSTPAPFLGSGLSYSTPSPFLGAAFNAAPFSYSAAPFASGSFQSVNPVVSSTPSSLAGLSVSTPSPLSVSSTVSDVGVSSSTPAPILGLIKSGISDDIQDNLISGGGASSTATPEVYSGRVVESSTASPIFQGSSPVPFTAYGAPLLKK